MGLINQLNSSRGQNQRKCLLTRGRDKYINDNEVKGLPCGSHCDVHLGVNKHFQKTYMTRSWENWVLVSSLLINFITCLVTEYPSTFEKAFF